MDTIQISFLRTCYPDALRLVVRVHSYYQRTPSDLSWGGRSVRLVHNWREVVECFFDRHRGRIKRIVLSVSQIFWPYAEELLARSVTAWLCTEEEPRVEVSLA